MTGYAVAGLHNRSARSPTVRPALNTSSARLARAAAVAVGAVPAVAPGAATAAVARINDALRKSVCHPAHNRVHGGR